MTAEQIIRCDMAKVKIFSLSELGRRLGITNRTTIYRKVKTPSTFTIYEIQALAKLFGWDDEQLGRFIKAI